MQRYYIDTCIWIDYFENRVDKFRPLGDWALDFLKKIIILCDGIVLSDHIINELINRYPADFVNDRLSIIPLSLITSIETTKCDSEHACYIMKEYGIPFADALHAVLAGKSDAILVTRDRHMDALGGLLVVRKPEELI
jgi:predicted nucleic acid-binding protein